jgi:hypothetical protein
MDVVGTDIEARRLRPLSTYQITQGMTRSINNRYALFANVMACDF